MLAFYGTPLGDKLVLHRGEASTVRRGEGVVSVIRRCVVVFAFDVKEPLRCTLQ